MNSTVFFTVFYPCNEKFHIDFLRSIETQTDQDFDLYIVNDGVENVEELLHEHFSGSHILKSFDGNMFEIREKAIADIISKGYDNIIFGDSDDYFDSNRVNHCKFLLKNFDVVVNEVSLVTSSKELIRDNYFSNRLTDLEQIDTDFIFDKNILGFTNTALKVSLLNKVSFSTTSLALDWFVFSQVLDKTEGAVFTKQTKTSYRQYDENIAKIDSKVSRELMEKEFTVKLEHYRSMNKIDSKYKDIFLKYKELSNNNMFEEVYSTSIKNPFWWERVQVG